MRKLSPIEESAYAVLCREGSILITGDELTPGPRELVISALDGLVKKKRATVEVTDGGNRYHAR